MADPSGQEVERAAARLEAFLDRLPLRPVLLGNVYDPTFADDRCGMRVACSRRRQLQAAAAWQVVSIWQLGLVPLLAVLLAVPHTLRAAVGHRRFPSILPTDLCSLNSWLWNLRWGGATTCATMRCWR